MTGLAARDSGPMTLGELGFADDPSREVAVYGLAASSRDVGQGYLFAALPGAGTHGARYVAEAVSRGAAAALTDAEGAALMAGRPTQIPLLVRDDPRSVLARTAAKWFGPVPERICAVTGTNGKTSTASMCRQIWQLLGHRAASCGTAGIEGDHCATTPLTTPEPIFLHRQLAAMHEAGLTRVVLEASSHGLVQRRLDGLQLAAGAFTNLSHDHFDYHDGWDAYFCAKASLFERNLAPGGTAVICIDDAFGERMAKVAQSRTDRILTVGTGEQTLSIRDIRCDAGGLELRFAWRGASRQLRLGLIGAFQARNALAAAGLAIGCGEDPDAVFDAMSRLAAAPGRMQLAARRSSGCPVYVDYAHTPHAVESALDALRGHMMGNLVVVLGAGGDRDPSKRKAMGQAADRHADRVFVTDDNPRTEDPGAIRNAVLQGCPGATEIGDRAEAILVAVDSLRPGDALLIAGKGHEQTQIVGNHAFPFSDAEQASIAVRTLDGHGA